MDRAAPDDFTAWVQARQQRLLRSAYLLTGDLHRAEDLVQEALLKVAQRWPRLREGNPDAYARTILYRDNASWWRRRRDYPIADVPEDAAGPADRGRDVEVAEVVRQALVRLPRRQRAVVVLRYFEDLSERETAAVLGVQPGTVKSQAATALRRLREIAPELAHLMVEESSR